MGGRGRGREGRESGLESKWVRGKGKRERLKYDIGYTSLFVGDDLVAVGR